MDFETLAVSTGHGLIAFTAILLHLRTRSRSSAVLAIGALLSSMATLVSTHYYTDPETISLDSEATYYKSLPAWWKLIIYGGQLGLFMMAAGLFGLSVQTSRND